jgi:uracil-DNA glycosylase family 4
MSIRRVEGEGPKDARIIFLGEAPGREEDEEGRPFIGQAGTLLNQLFASARIIRPDCYVTNVIKERPPTTEKKSNDISVFIDLDKHPVKESEEYKAYLSELKEELSQVSANIIVAFGNIPLYALTGIYPPAVTKRRGSVYESTLLPGRKVIASIHPAACLHAGKREFVGDQKAGGQYMWRYFILHDLNKAKREAEYPEVKQGNYKILTKPTLLEATEFIKEAAKQEVIAFDIEVINLEVSCFSIAFRLEYTNSIIVMSIPLVSGGQDYFSIEDELYIWHAVGTLLENKEITKIGQNIIFDSQFLFRKYGIVTRNIDDTMIAQGVLIPDFPKGLDFISSIYTDIPYYKDEGKKWFKMVGGTEENFWRYNAKDSIVCLEAFPKLIGDLRLKGNEETYERQKRLVEPLTYMSERGIRMDVEGMRGESERVGKRIDELYITLNRMAGREINWDSSKQVMDYLYDEKKYKEYKKKGTGKRTSDEDALKRLSRSGCAEASILLESRKLSKLKSTYLDVTLDSDNRLRCSFNPVGAADSGRLSSSETIWETGMNLQNDPPQFKKYMLFDEGYIGYSIDLAQAENRIVAYIAPEPRMLAAFERGEDVHKLTAALILNTQPERISDEQGSCPFCEHPNLCGHTERYWGKQANHAFNYGRGHVSMALKLEIQEGLAKRIRDSYHNGYLGVRVMWNWIQESLRQNRTLTNLFGRKRIFMAEWGDGLFREAYAFTPSSTVSDIINERGLIYIYYNQDQFKEVELLNQIHDSIVLQIPKAAGVERHLEIIGKIKASLETPLHWRAREFVIPADISVSTTNMKDTKKIKNMDQLKKYLEEEINENAAKANIKTQV